MSKAKTKPNGSPDVLKALGKEKALGMFRRMLEIREFEEQVRFLFLEGKMPGTVHQYIGQEACAVGVCSALEEGDVIASTHRPHGHALARGITMEEAAGELYGKLTGCCKGKGGSMHMGDLSRGMLPAIAIVGGNLPITAGMALAFKLRGEKRVAVSFFGDGAANEGAFHEALNAAAIYRLPAVYVCENNQYGASTAFSRVSLLDNVADRACAYGIEGRIADGMDVFAVHAAAAEALARARRGEGPTLLELKTFRLCGHSRRDPNNYMTQEEKEHWQSRDPIPACERLLAEAGWLDAAGGEAIKKETTARAQAAIAAAQAAPEPQADDLYQDLYVSMEVPR
ncbi:MAG: thiamine pyrophosphate-dependent dehydrogenase E1 component subunit alpha [Spirochaetales bacterium]|nr:thiamine pyrophosphate-dependent dehydrogenase E1 component subunit alpha [Spirochaetales bacterium]